MRILIVAVCSVALCSAVSAQTMVTLTPSEFINVSLDGDRNSPGTVSAGSVGSSTYITRERATLSQESMRIASFAKFDFSGLTMSQVNDATFAASLQADFDTRLNTVNAMAVGVGQVDDDGVNGDSWDASLAAGTVPLFEWGMNSADQQTLVPNVQTATLGDTFSVDVTPLVQDIVNGVDADNGFVLFGETAVFQGAGFENLELQLTVSDAVVPEPSSIAIWSLIGLGLAGFGYTRIRPKK